MAGLPSALFGGSGMAAAPVAQYPADPRHIVGCRCGSAFDLPQLSSAEVERRPHFIFMFCGF